MKKLLSLVAALALVGVACGGSGGPDPAEDPKGALVSALEELEGGSTMIFSIASTPESLDALARDDGGSGLEAEDAQKILDSSVTVSSEGEGEDAKAQVLVNVAGNSEAVEMRVLGKDLYVRADVRGLMEEFGADTSQLETVASQSEAQGLTFVRPAIDGEWLSIKGFAEQLSQFTGAAATPSADQQQILNQLVETIKDKAEVTEEGEEDAGTHLIVSLPVRDLYTEFVGTIEQLGGGMQVPMGDLPDPSEVPDEDVTLDVWVADGKVTQVELDFLTLAQTFAPEEEVPEGVDEFAFRIVVEDFSGDTSVPEGAVEVDPATIFQGLMGGVAPGGTGGTTAPGGTEFDCSQLEGAPQDVKDQFKDLCPNI